MQVSWADRPHVMGNHRYGRSARIQHFLKSGKGPKSGPKRGLWASWWPNSGAPRLGVPDAAVESSQNPRLTPFRSKNRFEDRVISRQFTLKFEKQPSLGTALWKSKKSSLFVKTRDANTHRYGKKPSDFKTQAPTGIGKSRPTS